MGWYNFFSNLYFNWWKVAFQCSVGFCCATMQISHNYTYTTSLLSLPPFPLSHHFRSSQSSKLDATLCYRATSHWVSVLHTVVYICHCYFLHLSHPLLPILHPQACFLPVCLHFFPVNRFINTIFLDSIYMH